jgi:hypothetical protein
MGGYSYLSRKRVIFGGLGLVLGKERERAMGGARVCLDVVGTDVSERRLELGRGRDGG